MALLLFLFDLCAEQPNESSVAWALSTFKEAIFEDPNMVLSNWNSLDADPCDWSGISCSAARDHVLKM